MGDKKYKIIAAVTAILAICLTIGCIGIWVKESRKGDVLDTYVSYSRSIVDKQPPPSEVKRMEDIAQGNALAVLKYAAEADGNYTGLPRPNVLPSTGTTQDFMPVEILSRKELFEYTKNGNHGYVDDEQDSILGTHFDNSKMLGMKSDDNRPVRVVMAKMRLKTTADSEPFEDDVITILVRGDDKVWRVHQMYTVMTKKKAKEIDDARK